MSNKDINLLVPFSLEELTVSLDEVISKLPIEEQEAIEQLTQELLDEYLENNKDEI